MMKLSLTLTAVSAEIFQQGKCTYDVTDWQACTRKSKDTCKETRTIIEVLTETETCYQPPQQVQLGDGERVCDCKTEVNGFATWSVTKACGYKFTDFGACERAPDGTCHKTRDIKDQKSKYPGWLGANCYPVGTVWSSSVTPFLNETCDCTEAQANTKAAQAKKQAALAKNGATCNEDKECASNLCGITKVGITNRTCMQGVADNRAGSEGCLYEFSAWGKCEKKGKNCIRERAILKWSVDRELYASGNCQSPPKGKFTGPHETLGTEPCEICTAAAPTARPTAITTQKPAAPKVTYTEKYCKEHKGFCSRQGFATFTTECKAVCEAHAATCTKFKEYCDKKGFTKFTTECREVCVKGQ